MRIKYENEVDDEGKLQDEIPTCRQCLKQRLLILLKRQVPARSSFFTQRSIFAYYSYVHSIFDLHSTDYDFALIISYYCASPGSRQRNANKYLFSSLHIYIYQEISINYFLIIPNSMILQRRVQISIEKYYLKNYQDYQDTPSVYRFFFRNMRTYSSFAI